ncbi:MAG: trigger factor, partial [Clostridiales bacterium]|nr:trigger factor [Clostridiales bacterium]
LACAVSVSVLLFTGSCGAKDPSTIDTGDGSVLSYAFELEPFIKVGEYKGVEVLLDPVNITDEDVDRQIAINLENAAEYEQIETGTVKSGDTVILDYVGTVDGQEIENGSIKNMSISVGSGKFMPEFEDALIGHSIGETVNFDISYPDDYQAAEIAGKTVTFTVTLKSILVVNIPELSDEWVAANTDASTVAEWKALVKQQLETQADYEQESKKSDLLWEKIMEGSEVLYYPEGPMKYYNDNYIKYYKEMAEANGSTIDDYLAQYGISYEQFTADAKNNAEMSVKTDLAFHYICEKEKITVSDTEFLTKANEFFEVYYKNNYETFEDFINDYGENTIKLSVLYEKMLNWLVENAVFTTSGA